MNVRKSGPNNIPGDRKSIRTDIEDEVNESRKYVENGTSRGTVSSPSMDGGVTEENEEVFDHLNRESPGSHDKESETASNSKFYGQGFGSGTHGGYADKDDVEQGEPTPDGKE